MARKLVLVLCFLTLICGRSFSSCTSPQNQIEAENCLPGSPSSQWSVSGAGDQTILGFATDMSVNAGQTINFKINTTATAYTIGIFRIGYYGGLGARRVASITPSAHLPQTQPACVSDAATRLFDCGTWGVSASWAVPSTAVSGVYLAVLVRSDTGGASQIVFVVRNDASTSDIVFQTADESWQAYNPYGGHSLYGATGFDLTNRANKVSYNRPFTTLNLENQSWIMYAEYPMIQWLEANGYDVTYVSSIDSARNGALLKNHKLYMSVGHDEYASGPKRTNIEAARDSGVNLAFFSGNEFFWKTRWENSVDGTNTPFRTLVCYKETLGPNSNPAATAAVDPLDPPTWTGTWRDPAKSPPADGGRPENALTGQLFRVNGPGTDNTNLSIKVPAAMGKLRFWRNAPNVSTQAAGATWTLPASSLGYEWDVEEDNGFRPAGLFDLSSATYPLTVDYLLDAGGVYGAGTATHKMSTYRAPSGALVFGAGTVQWSWGLDSSSGGTVDANMRQATVNLFADMGVQPATLQAGLLPATKSTDTIAPSSTIASPANGTSVQVGATLTATGTAADTGGGLVAGVEISVDSGATWHPVNGTTSWSYTWVASKAGVFSVLSRAVDDSANLEIPSAGVTVNVLGVSTLTLNPSTLLGGNSSQGTVTISAPAGTGGVTVSLSSSNTAVASVPSSVVVPAGNTSAAFPITTNAVGISTKVTITAGFVNTATATLTVNPVFPPAPGTVNIDATVSTHQGSTSPTITSGAFSTVAANELVLALISSDASLPNMTVTGVNGAGLTWTLVLRTNAQGGTAEIWRAFAPSLLTNVTATVTFSQSAPAASISIMTFAGVDTSGTNGSGAIGNTASASSANGAPTASLTTTRNNSWVLGVGNDYSHAIARTLGANQTLIDQFFTTTDDTLWSQRRNAPTPTSGTSVTINDTAPATDSFNLSIVEVRPPVAGTFSISGNASANGAGAAIALTGPLSLSVSADASGNYSFIGLPAGSYTVTPGKAGFAFSPASQAVSITTANVTNVNFTATPVFSISGTITPAASASGATLTLSGSGSATTTADSSGNYTFSGLVNGTYTITPSKTGFSFTPNSQTTTVNGANVTAINFTATALGFSISGNVSAGGAGATVALSGAATASTTADSSGNYSFAALANGTYTVTPTKPGFTFSPASQTATVNNANVSAVNFTATAQTFSISGNVSAGGAGATVALSGAATASTTADAAGNYSFAGLANGAYTVTPTKSGFTFSPASQPATVNNANVSALNFTATASGGTGLAIDVNVSRDGSTASTTIATPAFSTKATNELLLAFIATDFISGTNTTVTGVAGGGLTWKLVQRTNVQSGTAEIWTAFASTALTNVTVTATVSQSVVSSITLVSFTGVDTTSGATLPNAIGATGTGNSARGAPTASLVTTRSNSWVLGVGNDYDNPIARTLGAGQTLVHQFLTPTGDTYWVQMQSATTPLSGTSVTINDTAPSTDRYNLSIVEVRTP
ncbi:MAG TPA: N,N-dimethylformamidase beta subunit family domain-containing protein [Candidatus Angelobacter sp.]